MAVRSSISSRVKKTGFDDNQPASNKILLGIQRTRCKNPVPQMELVELTLHQVLYEAEATIEQCYFIHSGLISVVSVQPNQKSVEVGLIGNEGFVGLPVVVGYTSSPT